jgi:hypothetical protein
MNRGLENLNVLDKKRELETEFTNWVNADASRKAKYGNVLSELEKAYTNRAPFMSATSFLAECQLRGAEVFYFAMNAQGLEKALEEGNQENIAKAIEGMKKAGESFYKDYNPETDRKVIGALLKLYNDDIDTKYHPTFYAEINKKFKGDFQKFADYLFNKSVFMDETRFNAFLENPSLKVLQKDLAYQAGVSSLDKYREIKGMEKESAIAIDKNNRLFIAGLMEMQPEKVFYPDANFTMRLSYGKVGDYEPKDGVLYKHYTTIEGIMEKEDPDNFEFEVPARLKELWKNKDYGQYADAAGYMPVCFTSNNDITGGNSGSPVINAEGHLFGLAFDGNWEAMSGDIAFETELQKCINVDIRYVLFIIDKYAGATNLINEMTLVK